MSEIIRKKWLENPDLNRDVAKITEAILEKPNREDLQTLFEYLKDVESVERRRDARVLFSIYISKSCNNSNKALRNEFLDMVTNFKKDPAFFVDILTGNIAETLEKFNMNNFGTAPFLLPAINVLFQLECTGKNEKSLIEFLYAIFPLYNLILSHFTQHLSLNFDETYSFKNEELISLANNSMKQILWVLAKFKFNKFNEYVCDYLNFAYKILSFDKIGMDMKCKSGLLFVHCLAKVSEEELEHFVWKKNPILEITNESDSAWIRGKTFEFLKIHSNSAKVALISALFNILPLEDQLNVQLKNREEEVNVFVFIFEEFLKCADRPMKDNAEIVEITRNLLLMSEKLEKIPVDNFDRIFFKSLIYLHSYCEYHMDAVSKNSNLFMGHFIKTCATHYKKGKLKFIKHLLETINLKVSKRKFDFLLIMYISTYLGCSFLVLKMPALKNQIWELLQDQSCHEDASTAYEILMKEHYKEIPFKTWLKTWLKPAVELLKTVSEDKIQVYERIICRGFQLNEDILKELFPTMGCRREWGVLLKCLSYSRNCKSAPPRWKNTYDSSIYWWGLIEKSKLKMFAVQRDDLIRVSALRVIVECNRSTEMFTEWEFSFMIVYYILNGAVQVPNVRKQIVTLYKKALTRYSASLETIKKQIETLVKRQQQQQAGGAQVDDWLGNFKKLQDCYKSFITQLMQLLIWNLSPSANFYRRNSALELLTIVQSILEPNEWNDFWKNGDVTNLNLILMDSYESNKKMALELLLSFDKKRYKLCDSVIPACYLTKALTYACDMKPSKCLSAAYMFQLGCNAPNLFDNADQIFADRTKDEMALNIIIFIVSEILAKLNADIFEDATGDEALKSPCYGMLLCLRYLMKNKDKTVWGATYASAYTFILTICQRFFKILLPIVSTPAPEGYLPDEENENLIRDDTAKSQKILVYAWRTIKEITLLFAEFAVQNSDHPILTIDECVEIGNNFVEIFTQAKHRGVFEQAYVAFILICESYWKSEKEKINKLPLKWLRDVLESTDKISPTRRSAGLPFMIMGILTTDPSLDKAAFHKTMKILMASAADETEKSDIRTHSINILRFLFRNTKLGELVSSYIEKTAELTLRGLQSNDWAIRNSSTLLFAALMTRLFGVQRTQDSESVTSKNKMTVKVFTSRYPQLFNSLLETLKNESGNSSNNLVLHPVLLVFSRLYPGHSELYNDKVEEAILYIRKCLSNCSFEIRRLAARASIALIFPKDVHLKIEENFRKIGELNVKNNECHGLLLEIWYALRYKLDENDKFDLNKLVKCSRKILEETGRKVSQPVVALYMNIISFLFGKYENQHVDPEILREILKLSTQLMSKSAHNLIGRYNFEASIINLTISIVLSRRISEPLQRSVDFDNYLSLNRGVAIKTYCLHFILHILRKFNEHFMVEPLYLYEEIRVPELIKNDVDFYKENTRKEFLTSIHESIEKYLKNEYYSMKTGFPNMGNVECCVLNLLLLSCHPRVLLELNDGNVQETFEDLLNFAQTPNKNEIKSAVVSCLANFLTKLDQNTLKRLNFKRLIALLQRMSCPNFDVHGRLTVCRFLLKCRFLYYNLQSSCKCMKSHCLVHFLNMVMTLFEDESLEIRNEMSALTDERECCVNKYMQCSPDKARFDFVKNCFKILPKSLYISFLLSWSIRHFPDDVSKDVSDVFERSALNTYAENVPIIQIAGKILGQILWNLPFNLNLDDKSIFIEEQCQMVTTILLDSFNNCNFSHTLVDPKTKISVICLFRSILVYLDLKTAVDNKNFKGEFSKFFAERVATILKKIPYKKDFDCAKRIFALIYQPVLVDNFEV